MKNYSEAAVNDLFNTLVKNTETGRCVTKLQAIYGEIKIPAVKRAIIHDMCRFLSDWFTLVHDASTIENPVLLNKVLSAKFINADSYLRSTIGECNRVGRSNRSVNIVVSYCKSCIKAIIMTSRRKYGFDCQGKHKQNS